MSSVLPADYPNGFRKGFWLVLGSVSLLLFFALLPPFVGESMRGVLMTAFSHVCHQLPARSMHIEGVSVAVCHRCLGAYAGFVLGGVLFAGLKGWWPVPVRKTAYLLAAAVVPGVLDWSGDVAGLWTNTPTSRMITGAIFGIVAGYILMLSVVESFGDQVKTHPEG